MRQRPLLIDIAGLLGALVLVTAIYLSAYFALLEGKRLDHRVGFNSAMANNYFVPKYRAAGPTLRVVFYPANQLDRRLRSHYWNTLLGWHELGQ